MATEHGPLVELVEHCRESGRRYGEAKRCTVSPALSGLFARRAAERAAMAAELSEQAGRRVAVCRDPPTSTGAERGDAEWTEADALARVQRAERRALRLYEGARATPLRGQSRLLVERHRVELCNALDELAAFGSYGSSRSARAVSRAQEGAPSAVAVTARQRWLGSSTKLAAEVDPALRVNLGEARGQHHP